MNKLRTILQLIEPQNAMESVNAELVERMLALQKEHQSVRREDDLDRFRNLEREIVRVDEEIDRRVYVLYELSLDETKIVQGS